MEEDTKDTAVRPQIPAGVMRVLCEKLAARVDTAASMVELDHLVKGYCSDDPTDRNRLAGELERAFGISLDASRLESTRTVAELAELVVERIAAKKQEKRGKNGRGYFVTYKTAEGRLVEAHVHARNHEAAIEALRDEGLEEVVSVEREQDEDEGGRNVHNRWNGCVIPVVIALLVGALVVGYFWFRHR